MYREIITASSADIVLHLPDELVGKQIEISASEYKPKRELPKSKLTKEQFAEMFGVLNDSKMNIVDMRAKAWRKYEW